MTRLHAWPSAGALAVAAASPAIAAPVALTASGPWHLDYSADSCTLARAFGKGDDEVIVRFEQFQPGAAFALTFIGKAFRTSQLYRPVKIAFGPGQPLRSVEGAVTGSAITSDKRKLDMLFISSATLAGTSTKDESGPRPDERTISELAVVQRDGADYVLKLGPMDRPMDQMRLCLDELVSHWGIDAAKQRTLTRKAKPQGNPGEWLRPNDYPGTSLQRGESALIHFRLTVSPEGAVSDCAIQRATKGDAFAKTSCDLIRQRAHFEPALDAEGKPVASYYVNTVRWLAAAP